MVDIITSLIVIFSSIMTIHSLIKEETMNEEWWDFLNHYVTFNDEYTHMIDYFVMENCKVRHKIFYDNSIEVPNIGRYSVLYEEVRIGIIKKIKKINNIHTFYYKIYSFDSNVLDKFNRYLINYKLKDDEITVTSIDTSGDSPKLYVQNKLCKKIKNNQKEAIDIILDHWKNDHNLKVMVHGERGFGKSYLCKLLKKEIEKRNENMKVILFDDVNPAIIGMNINTMILNKASIRTPVIIVINEIDLAYDKVIDGEITYDHRLQYIRNHQQFHNFLDDIGEKKYVIALYTSERDPKDMYNDLRYTSFMRLGRIDFFVNMSREHSTIYDHEYLKKIEFLNV